MCWTTVLSFAAAHASLKVWLHTHRVKLVGSQGLVGVLGHCGGNHKYHSSLGGFSSNYMNRSWRSCTQFMTSGNWKEKKCDWQGTACSVSRGGDQAVLPLPEMLPHSRKDACTQTQPASRRCSFPTGFSENRLSFSRLQSKLSRF